MLTITMARITLNSPATARDRSPFGGFFLLKPFTITSLLPVCLSGGAASVAFCVALRDDDDDYAEEEGIYPVG